MNPTFTSIVFAGGGGRCLWQAGFYESFSSAKCLELSEVACVSAGAFFSCLALSGRMGKAVDYFLKVTAENKKNIYPENILRRKPVFPQYDMYSKGLSTLLDGDALTRLKNGPDIQIQITRPPAWLGPRSATMTGFLAYSIEKKISHPVHPVLTRKLGFKPEVISVRECNTPEELADLILQSSCTPPFVPIMKRNGYPALDGGLVDNVPVNALRKNNGQTLILLTRQYAEENIPEIPGRIYVQPSEHITLDKWNYADPEGLLEVYELGQKDGAAFLNNQLIV